MKRALAIAAACAAMVRGAPAFAQQSSSMHATPSVRPAHATVGARDNAAPAAEGVVNINTATEQELLRLPGIGPTRATAIVSLRQRVQRFHAADDLLRVRGIGRAGLRRLRPYVTLNGNTTLASRPGRGPVLHAAAEGGAN
jgi:competence protein ComEA